jgi:hypothetical protein
MNVPMYERSTRMVRFDELSMPMTRALAEHAESRQLVLADDMPAWLTHSVNLPSQSLFGKLLGHKANRTDRDKEHDVLVVLHTTNVIIVTSGEKRGTSALSLPIAHATIRVGSALETTFSATEDSGFTLGGFPGDHGQSGTFYIGLGTEPAGAECAEAIRAAITDAKNP